MPEPATPRPPPRPESANRTDYISGTLLTVATVLCAGSLFVGGEARPNAFTWISGVVAVAFFFGALIGFWLEPLQRRHGYVRMLSLAGAAVLAGSGLAFTRAFPGLTLLAYWAPAALAVVAAITLGRGHREAGDQPVRVTLRRRAAPPR